jgi:ketosteroid isomerase-like protein
MRIATSISTTALALALLAATSATASDKADVVAAINRYNDSFNKNDAKAAEAICTPQTIIIDDFAPHAWQGATTCADWWNALNAENKKSGITDPNVTLGKAWHVMVTGDRAYAVYPTYYSYKLNGKPTKEQGVWTFALTKTADGWHIQGWAWAQH